MYGYLNQSCTTALRYDRRTGVDPYDSLPCDQSVSLDAWMSVAAWVPIGILRPCLVIIVPERRRDELLDRRSPKVHRMAEIVCNFVVADDTN